MTTQSYCYMYLSKGRILLIGNTLDNGDHSHHALQITLTLADRPFIISHPLGEQRSHCSIIKPNYQHKVDVSNTWRLLILVDADTDAAKLIEQRHLQNQAIIHPSEEDLDYCRERMKSFVDQQQTIEEAEQAIDDVITRFAGTIVTTREKDKRINKVLKIINQAKGEPITAEYLAEQVNLSRDRLSHLFKDEVGIPIKSYLMWSKLCQTGFKVFTGVNLTQAALEGGFSDAAHFSRTFRKVFGMTPSKVLREGQSVKLISDMPF